LPTEEQRYFPDLLGWAIAAYQYDVDSCSPEHVYDIACQLLDYIERGRTHGIIKDNIRLTDRFKECQEQNQRLKDNQQKLEREILELELENKNLHDALSKFEVRSDVTQGENP